MRVSSSVADVQYNIQQSEQSVQTALEQLSTGKRVNQISDDPTAYASMVKSLAESANVDRFTSTAGSVSSRLQNVDSAISSVITQLNSAITAGTSGANSSSTTATKQELASQVQSILGSVVSIANTSSQGSYVFGGSNTTQVPFTADSTSASGYTYNGNSDINTAQVGNSMTVSTNIPGDQLFTAGADVLGSLTNLVSALQSGDSTAIGTATNAISTAISYLGEQRAPLDNTINQVNSQETYLQQETVTLTTQQTNLVGIDTATAATNVTSAETQQSAVLAAAAKVLPQSLLQYLQ